MSYIDDMRALTEESFDKIHEGVRELTFTQFPDHANVGDSAIALGQDRYWEARSIRIQATYSVQILPESAFNSRLPVLIHGGGNFGGLYPSMSRQRLRLARDLPSTTRLIQAPQSVHFTNDAELRAFRQDMAPRPNTVIGVRDTASLEAVSREGAVGVLSPDAVHLLGSIGAPNPTRSHVVLARTDKESAQSARVAGSVDWIRDPISMRTFTWFSWRSSRLEMAKPLFYMPHRLWMRRAQARFDRGIAVLSQGETIITDRLHAALIGLQMGRRVVAVDNNNSKLSNYSSTWRLAERANFEIVSSIDDALARV